MKFKVLFLAHTPDAEPENHRSEIETSKYKLFVVLARNQEQALKVRKEFSKEEGIHSILLCPGFTYEHVAEISETVGKEIGVFVARGDGPSQKVSHEIMRKAGWFPEEE